MENSQIHNDLKRKFFVVLIMLSVFFVGEAFGHWPGAHPHPHTGCPPNAELSDEGTWTIDGQPIDFSHYPDCAFASDEPQTPDPEQQPGPGTTPGPLKLAPTSTNPTLAPTSTNPTNDGNNQGLAPTSTNPTNDGNNQGGQEALSSLQQQPEPQSVPRNPSDAAATVPPRPYVATVTRSPLKRLLVTEYMLLDWSVGNRKLPQWVELYNPNASEVDLTGYTFSYATFNRHTHEYEISPKPIPLKIVIPARDAVILTTRSVPNQNARIQGIPEAHVFNLKIGNVLKKGWRIVTPNTTVLHEIGTLFTEGLVGNPVLPPHVERTRQSYQPYASQAPTERHNYGHWQDIGSPGFYREVLRAPAAPTLGKKRILTTSWASLKKLRNQ